MTRDQVHDLIQKRDDLEDALQQVEHELTDMLSDFDGSVNEAIVIGLVTPNFAVPAYYRRWLLEAKQR